MTAVIVTNSMFDIKLTHNRSDMIHGKFERFVAFTNISENK